MVYLVAMETVTNHFVAFICQVINVLTVECNYFYI
jgi:hypothetical protein